MLLLGFWSNAQVNQYALGMNVVGPGCSKIELEPHLGDLTWVKGTFPTPYGVVESEHRKQADGTIATSFEAYEEVTVILK